MEILKTKKRKFNYFLMMSLLLLVCSITTSSAFNTYISNPYSTFNGSVGIGTSTPTSVLDLNGDLGGHIHFLKNMNNEYGAIEFKSIDVLNQFGGNISLNFNPEEGFGVVYSDTLAGMGLTPNMFYVDINNNQHTLYIDSNANVGLGRNNPTSKLYVEGNITVNSTSDVCIEGGNCLSSAGGSGLWSENTTSGETWLTNTSMNVGMGTNTPSTKLHVNGTLTLEDGYGKTGTIREASYGVGNGRIEITAGGTNDNILTVSDGFNTIFSVSTSNHVSSFRDSLSVGDNFTVDTDTLHIDSVSDRVGIGTSTPSAKLDVEVSSGGGATIGSSGCSATGEYAIAMGHNTVASRDYSTTIGSGTTASEDYTFATGHNTLVSGRYSSAFGSSTTASGRYSIVTGVGNNVSGDYAFTGGRYMQPTSGRGTFVWGASGSIQSFAPADSRFLIFPQGGGGRVGIGLVNPVSELQVNGSIQVGDGTNQKNITMTSPDGTEYSCGVANGGTFSCS